MFESTEYYFIRRYAIVTQIRKFRAKQKLYYIFKWYAIVARIKKIKFKKGKKMSKNEITIDGEIYVKKSEVNNYEMVYEKDGLKAVLIRSYAAGVHFGYLKREKFTSSGKVVVLVNTRRVWYWQGAASLSQMALEGVSKPKECKFSVSIPENEIVNVIETIPLTDKAIKSLYEVKEWKN